MMNLPPEPTSAEWREAERRWATDSHVVVKDYGVRAGVLEGKSVEVARRYYPIASPGLLHDVSRLSPGNEGAVRRFAMRWGVLGFDGLRRAARLKGFVGGDPLVWIWAHAQGIRVVLALDSLMRRGDATGLQAYVDRQFLLAERTWVAMNRANQALESGVGVSETTELVGDLFDPWGRQEDARSTIGPSRLLLYGDRHRLILYGWSGTSEDDAQSVAKRFITKIINSNMSGMYQEIRSTLLTPEILRERGLFPVRGPFPERGLYIANTWDALISVVYRHLADIVVGTAVLQCEACGVPFVQTHARQRFCPTEIGKRSLCEMRYQKARQRERLQEGRQS